MKRLTITGRTYSIKDTLKAEGFRWNSATKAWFKDFQDTDETITKTADLYDTMGGFTTTITKVNDPNERKYFVKGEWVFNLESMHDKLWCVEYDLRDGKLQFPITIAKTDIKDWDDLEDFRQECYNLESRAKGGKVTGKEYGRIREIICWRVEVRYVTCLQAGMEEKEAAGCFQDL